MREVRAAEATVDDALAAALGQVQVLLPPALERDRPALGIGEPNPVQLLEPHGALPLPANQSCWEPPRPDLALPPWSRVAKRRGTGRLRALLAPRASMRPADCHPIAIRSPGPRMGTGSACEGSGGHSIHPGRVDLRAGPEADRCGGAPETRRPRPGAAGRVQRCLGRSTPSGTQDCCTASTSTSTHSPRPTRPRVHPPTSTSSTPTPTSASAPCAAAAPPEGGSALGAGHLQLTVGVPLADHLLVELADRVRGTASMKVQASGSCHFATDSARKSRSSAGVDRGALPQHDGRERPLLPLLVGDRRRRPPRPRRGAPSARSRGPPRRSTRRRT